MTALPAPAGATILKLRRPVVTEKATRQAAAFHPGYTFTVNARANKAEIKMAITARFGVKPVKINIIRMPAKRVWRQGRAGRRPGFKKAIVFLKPGDKIEVA